MRHEGRGGAPGGGALGQVLDRNIAALLARRRAEERARSAQGRIAEALGRFAGSMPFVWIHLAVVDLDLQISLLAEHELTRLIRLNAQMAQRLGLEPGRDPELGDIERDVAPEEVLDRLREAESNEGDESPRGV